MKLANPQVDVVSYLPKFYSKQTQISSILNPLLKNIRQSKVSSYQQLQQFHSLALQQKPNQSDEISKKHVFAENPFQNFISLPDHPQRKQSKNLHDKVPKLRIGQNIFSQTKKLQNNQSQYQALDPIQKSRNFSFNLRSKTSDNMKKHKKVFQAPCTADFSRNTKQSQERKKRFLFNDGKNYQQSFDEQLSNYLQLKLFSKGPSFSGGKFSKFKKHLVEEINLEQIEKKFYQNPSTTTNYKYFFQKILNRRKQSQLKNQYLMLKNHHTISQIGKKGPVKYQKKIHLKKKQSFNSIRQSFSQTIQIVRPIEIDRGASDQKKRKRSVKAVLCYKKNWQIEESIEKQFCQKRKSLNAIQVTGKRKNILFSKK